MVDKAVDDDNVVLQHEVMGGIARCCPGADRGAQGFRWPVWNWIENNVDRMWMQGCRQCLRMVQSSGMRHHREAEADLVNHGVSFRWS